MNCCQKLRDYLNKDMTIQRLTMTFLLSPLLMAVSASAPNLQIFETKPFVAGLWRLVPLDEDTRARMPQGRTMCIADPNILLHTGFEQIDANCGHTVIEDSADHGVVTYVCRGKGSGRASIRRTGINRYIVEVQGIANRQPFDMRGEYQRIANCTSRN